MKKQKQEFIEYLQKYHFTYFCNKKLHFVLYGGFNVLQATSLKKLKEKFEQYLILRTK
jgi:hypothetical protein